MMIPEEYHNQKKGILIFYRINDEKKLEIILNSHSNSKFNFIEAEVDLIDNNPLFSISRIMAHDYFGIFSPENIGKLSQSHDLEKKNLTKNFEWYELFSNETYNYWLERLSDEKIIQYDHENFKAIFQQIEIKDISKLNENLKKLKINIKFEAFEYSKLKNEQMPLCVDEKIFKLMDFDWEAHIKETNECYEQDKLDYFIIISNRSSPVKKVQVSMFNQPPLFQGLYRRNKEKWLFYCTWEMSFPSEEVLAKTKAIIIPGSRISVNSDQEYIIKTKQWIQLIHEKYKQIKIIGFCTGLELIISSFGGNIQQLESKKFINFPERISLKEKFWDLPFIANSNIEKNDLNLIEAHVEEVTNFPDYFENYGSSNSCNIEILISKDHRYFLLQGHPEYSIEFCVYRLAAVFAKQSGCKTLEEFNEMKEKCSLKISYEDNQVQWRKFCYGFIKHNT